MPATEELRLFQGAAMTKVCAAVQHPELCYNMIVLAILHSLVTQKPHKAGKEV